MNRDSWDELARLAEEELFVCLAASLLSCGWNSSLVVA